MQVCPSNKLDHHLVISFPSENGQSVSVEIKLVQTHQNYSALVCVGQFQGLNVTNKNG